MTENKTEARIMIRSMEELAELYGRFDQNVATLEQELHVQIRQVGDGLHIQGEAEDTQLAATVLEKLMDMVRNHENIEKSRIHYAIELAREGQAERINEIMGDVILVTYKGKPIKCKTLGQKKYINAIRKNTVVVSIGPAGTGKTYLAMAMAVVALKNKEISRIILTRPAVEAGEKLGFLPGDLQNKVDPYLRPLYDALFEMVGNETYARLVERGVIEVAPMAYMRGRTLSDSFVILDEAQNTTPEQMKMFLTRLGEGSKMVINGDATQIDLGEGKRSGLIEAAEVLRGVEDVAVTNLTGRDVVRHELVQNIIAAYEKHATQRQKGRGTHERSAK